MSEETIVEEKMTDTPTEESSEKEPQKLDSVKEEAQSETEDSDKAEPKKKRRFRRNSKETQLKERVEELEALVSEKEKQIKDNEDVVSGAQERVLRAHAELENYKKRKEQEVTEFKKYAAEKMIAELLPVLDSFDRAVEHAEQHSEESHEETVNGFLLIQKQFHSMLEKAGVKKN